MKIKSQNDIKWGFPFYALNNKGNSQYLYLIKYDHKVGPGMEFHEGLVKIAEANKKCNKDNIYICYGSWIGKGIVWRVYSLKDKADLSNVIEDKKVLIDAFGDEDGRKMNEEFQETLLSEDKKLLSLIPEFTNSISKKIDFPFQYLYYAEIELKKNYKEIYGYIKKLVVAAKNKTEKINWTMYAEENNKSLHLYVGINKFSELDLINNMKEILESYYEKDEASMIRNGINGVLKKYQSTLMTLVENCDNSGFQIID